MISVPSAMPSAPGATTSSKSAAHNSLIGIVTTSTQSGRLYAAMNVHRIVVKLITVSVTYGPVTSTGFSITML